MDDPTFTILLMTTNSVNHDHCSGGGDNIMAGTLSACHQCA